MSVVIVLLAEKKDVSGECESKVGLRQILGLMNRHCIRVILYLLEFLNTYMAAMSVGVKSIFVAT